MPKKKKKSKQSNFFPKKMKTWVALIAAFVIVGGSVYYLVLSSFASGPQPHSWITYTRNRNISIPGSSGSDLTLAGITTFGGKCENADNGLSALDNKSYRKDGVLYAALRIGDDSGSSSKDSALISAFKKDTNLRKFLTHKKIYLRNPINGKTVIARLDDWGPSASVVSAAKKKNSNVRTVIDASPEVANALGLGNKDAKCKSGGKNITETSIGKNDNKTVQIGFYW